MLQLTVTLACVKEKKHNSKNFDEYYIDKNEGKSQNNKPKSKIANNNDNQRMSTNNHAVKYKDSEEEEYREMNVEYSEGNMILDAHDNQSKNKRARRKEYSYLVASKF